MNPPNCHLLPKSEAVYPFGREVLNESNPWIIFYYFCLCLNVLKNNNNSNNSYYFCIIIWNMWLYGYCDWCKLATESRGGSVARMHVHVWNISLPFVSLPDVKITPGLLCTLCSCAHELWKDGSFVVLLQCPEVGGKLIWQISGWWIGLNQYT
jgi:hypothetical protein